MSFVNSKDDVISVNEEKMLKKNIHLTIEQMINEMKNLPYSMAMRSAIEDCKKYLESFDANFEKWNNKLKENHQVCNAVDYTMQTITRAAGIALEGYKKINGEVPEELKNSLSKFRINVFHDIVAEGKFEETYLKENFIQNGRKEEWFSNELKKEDISAEDIRKRLREFYNALLKEKSSFNNSKKYNAIEDAIEEALNKKDGNILYDLDAINSKIRIYANSKVEKNINNVTINKLAVCEDLSEYITGVSKVIEKKGVEKTIRNYRLNISAAKDGINELTSFNNSKEFDLVKDYIDDLDKMYKKTSGKLNRSNISFLRTCYANLNEAAAAYIIRKNGKDELSKDDVKRYNAVVKIYNMSKKHYNTLTDMYKKGSITKLDGSFEGILNNERDTLNSFSIVLKEVKNNDYLRNSKYENILNYIEQINLSSLNKDFIKKDREIKFVAYLNKDYKKLSELCQDYIQHKAKQKKFKGFGTDDFNKIEAVRNIYTYCNERTKQIDNCLKNYVKKEEANYNKIGKGQIAGRQKDKEALLGL